ncbi:protein of unknown function [Burkholderia multivorans]
MRFGYRTGVCGRTRAARRREAVREAAGMVQGAHPARQLQPGLGGTDRAGRRRTPVLRRRDEEQPRRRRPARARAREDRMRRSAFPRARRWRRRQSRAVRAGAQRRRRVRAGTEGVAGDRARLCLTLRRPAGHAAYSAWPNR